MPPRGLSWSICFDMLKKSHSLNLKHIDLCLSLIKVYNLQFQLNEPSLEIEDAFKSSKMLVFLLF